MDKTSGRTRLRNPALLGPLDDWMEFSAWLRAEEYECFWVSILSRMRRDWDEPDMAKYLEAHILDLHASRKASWRCSFDCTPLGFTTYAANCIESYWRCLKSLLDPSIKWANCGQLIEEVVAIVTSKFEKGDYDGLFHECDDKVWFHDPLAGAFDVEKPKNK